MGQVLHGSATTTHAVRAAIQRSTATIAEMSDQYGVNPKTILKWRNRTFVEDRAMGPKEDGPQFFALKKKPCVSLFASIRCCPWMIASTRCKRRSRT